MTNVRAPGSERGGRSTKGRPALAIAAGDALTRPLKISETFARDLVHDIVARGLKVGDRLSSEGVMLNEYGVSRESLREGLRLLEVQGLIVIRRGPGGGPVVGPLDPSSLGRTATLYYHLAGGTYADLFAAWITVESLLAGRAARSQDRSTVRAAMAPFLEEEEKPGDEDSVGILEFASSHSSFHSIVASLGQNRVLEILLPTIGLIVTHHVVSYGDPREVREIIEADHAVLAHAIVAGHASKAALLMEEHITRIAEHFGDQMGERVNDYIDWR